MPIMKVIKPGFQSTIQDLDRCGYSHFGVSASGAADAIAFRFGNMLLGNNQNSPALEMTLTGGEFLFETETIISITGSDFEPTLNGNKIPLWQTIFVKADQTLRFGSTKTGARCYLCIKGGFDIKNILGSVSTHLLTHIGGINGRVLSKNDEIKYYESNFKNFNRVKIKNDVINKIYYDEKIFVTSTTQTDQFSKESLELFSSSIYKVSEEVNRMGLRLTGPQLHRIDNQDIITEGVSLGAIQVSHDGNPIILFVEHQTTGGYPKIANVISANIHKVGQLRPRDEIKFSFVSIDKAYKLRMELESLISPRSFTAL